MLENIINCETEFALYEENSPLLNAYLKDKLSARLKYEQDRETNDLYKINSYDVVSVDTVAKFVTQIKTVANHIDDTVGIIKDHLYTTTIDVTGCHTIVN